MLRATLNVHHNINIASYNQLLALIKRKGDGFKSKKSRILTRDQILNFLENAPDSEYLLMKVITIIKNYILLMIFILDCINNCIKWCL